MATAAENSNTGAKKEENQTEAKMTIEEVMHEAFLLKVASHCDL